MTNGVRTLYVGVTNDLERRIYEHKHKLVDGFTKKYNLTWLAYYEDTTDVTAAIEREKQIKGWRRSKKVTLIESMNPNGRTCRWNGTEIVNRHFRFFDSAALRSE